MCIKHITFTDQNSAFIDLPKYTRLTVGRCHHPQGCSLFIDHPGPFCLLSSLEHRLGTRAERRASRSNDLLAVLVACLGVVPLGGLGTRPTERRQPGQRAWQHSQPRFYSRLGVRNHYSHVVVFSSPVRRSRRDAHPYQLSSACFTCPIRHRDPVHVGRARAHARLLSARVSVVPCRGMSMNVPGSIYNMTLAPHGQEHHDTAYILQSTGTITDILFGFFGFLVVDVQPRGCCQLGQLSVI